MQITGATYDWSGDEDYLCAAGDTYDGTVTGLRESGYSFGQAKVEIYSPFSETTVKGIKEMSVTSAPSAPYIEGPESGLVCSSGESFRLYNIPEGNTITWSSSSNLNTSNPHANPTTFVSTGNGSGWVKATLSTACRDISFSYDVWSGAPVISSISGPTSTPNGQWATYHAVFDNEFSGATDYNWILNPLNGNSVYDYGDDVDIAFYNSGYYQLLVQALNTCSDPNFGSYYGTSLYVYDSENLLFTPNPTSGETLLTIESTGKEGQFDETAEWEMEIYDQSQLLKEKKTKIKGKSTKIQTAGWKEGIYMVRVKYKDEILTGKLVVKR